MMEFTDIDEEPRIISAILWPFRNPISFLLAATAGISLAFAYFAGVVQYGVPAPWFLR